MKKTTTIVPRDTHLLNYDITNAQCVGVSHIGNTYITMRTDQGRPVILKEIALSNLSPDKIELLEEYIAAMKNITCSYMIHYSVVNQGDSREKLYLESEYCCLGSLQSTIDTYRTNGKLIPENFIWHVAATIIFTLEDFHTQLAPKYCSGRNFRCLKPSNILLLENNLVKIDGLSVTCLSHRYNHEVYIAPELLSETVDASDSDVWSFGCILLAMCTLAEPNIAIQQRTLDELLDLSTLSGIENYSHELIELIKKCLHISITMRATVSQLRSHPRIWAIIETELRNSQVETGLFLLSPKQSTFTSNSQQNLPIIYSPSPPPSLFSQMTNMQPPGLGIHATHDQDRGIIQSFNTPHALQSLPLPLPMPMQVPLQVPKLNNICTVEASGHEETDLFNQIHQISNQMATMIYMSVQKFYSQQSEERIQSTSQTAVSLLPESMPDDMVDSDETALMIAVRNKNMPMLFNHISQLKRRKNDGTTALMIAAETGNSEALSYLLGEYRLQREDGKTGLMIAIIHGHIAVAKVLVDFESKIQDKNGRTALMYACENGMAELINMLADSESGLTDANGYSALMIALQTNNLDGVRVLVSKEALIALPDGTTPLIIAENLDNLDLLELVKKHIDTDTNDEKESLKTEESQSQSAEETHMKLIVYDPPIEYMRGVGQNKNNEGTTNLMEAARIGSVCGVKQYIYEKKQTDSKGWTALMKAAFYGKTECIPLLKEEMRMSNKAKYTALMSAAGNGHSACVRLLLSEAKMRNWKGETALMVAIMNEQDECIKLLMDKEGSMRTTDGLTMLEYAIKHNKTNSVEVIKTYTCSQK